MPNTVFARFIKSMSDRELVAYAAACKTSPAYLTGHLRPRKKTPRLVMMSRLVRNSAGQLTREDVLEHFFPTSDFESDAA